MARISRPGIRWSPERAMEGSADRRAVLRGVGAALILVSVAAAGWWVGERAGDPARSLDTKPLAMTKNKPPSRIGVAAMRVALTADEQQVGEQREDRDDGPEPGPQDDTSALELLDIARLDLVEVEPEPERAAPEAGTADAEPESAPEQAVPRVAEPPPAEAALAEAERLVASGDTRAAMDAYRRALVMEPELGAARVGYARILAGAGRAARARDILAEGLERDPGNRVLARHYATLAMEVGDRDAARWALERAVRPVAAGQVEAQLAYLHRTAGRHEAARELYARLATAEPDEPRWLTGLGRSAEADGDREAAMDAWRRLLQIDRLDPELRRWARGRLETLTRD